VQCGTASCAAKKWKRLKLREFSALSNVRAEARTLQLKSRPFKIALSRQAICSGVKKADPSASLRDDNKKTSNSKSNRRSFDCPFDKLRVRSG